MILLQKICLAFTIFLLVIFIMKEEKREKIESPRYVTVGLNFVFLWFFVECARRTNTMTFLKRFQITC